MLIYPPGTKVRLTIDVDNMKLKAGAILTIESSYGFVGRINYYFVREKSGLWGHDYLLLLESKPITLKEFLED